MRHDDPRHGTYSGYGQHKRDKETPCGPCRAANTEYTRTLRKDPIQRIKSRQVSKAGSRAAWRLVDAHREEYERLYAEELAATRPTSESVGASS